MNNFNLKSKCVPKRAQKNNNNNIYIYIPIYLKIYILYVYIYIFYYRYLFIFFFKVNFLAKYITNNQKAMMCEVWDVV